MSRPYRGRRRGTYIPPLLILIVLIAALAAGYFFLLRPMLGGEQTPAEPDSQDVDGGSGSGGTESPRTGDESEPPPEDMTTDSGIACTLTDLGEEAIYTGELILVNNWTDYHFPEDQELVSLYEEKSDSYYIRSTELYLAPAAMEALNALLDDFAAQGGSKTINVVACYRTAEEQQHLFDQSAERSGLDHAEKYVAQPGGSEHHTALVVDLSVLNSDGTSSEYDGTGEYAWINENCQDYGWVVRYDQAKAELTGIYDEPWHFRYVGVPHATKMAELDLCLEEYIDYLKDFTFEGDHLTIDCASGRYEAWYAQGTEIYLPDDGEYTVSGNNVDGLIVTCRVG